jgi:hypothetical protein
MAKGAPKRAAKKTAVKLTDDEKAARLAQRAIDTRNMGHYKKVCEGLKSRFDLLPGVIDHLKTVGLDVNVRATPQPKAILDCMSTPQKANLRSDRGDASTVASSCGGSVGSKGDDEDVEDGLVLIPLCYTTVGAVPPKYLIKAMSCAEPSALSSHALRGLVRGKSRHISKVDILEVWELVTNLDQEKELPIAFHNMGVLCAHVVRFNEERGRPARDLVMRPVWSKNGVGVYDLQVVSKTKVLVTHRMLMQTKALPSKFLKQVKDVNFLVLDDNFSERRAVVKDAQGYSSSTLMKEFPDLFEENAFTAVIPTRAIEDGSCEDEVAEDELADVGVFGSSPASAPKGGAKGNASASSGSGGARGSAAVASPPRLKVSVKSSGGFSDKNFKPQRSDQQR